MLGMPPETHLTFGSYSGDPAMRDLRMTSHLARYSGVSFGAFSGRPAYAATAEVSIYVAPGAQRRGIATGLMEEALSRAGGLGIRTFLGFVFAHNDRSVALCRRFQFEIWGRLPRVAVLDGVERDLLILGRRLGDEEQPHTRASRESG